MKEKYSTFFKQLDLSNYFVALNKRNDIKFCIYKDNDGNYWNNPSSWKDELININSFARDFKDILRHKPILKILAPDELNKIVRYKIKDKTRKEFHHLDHQIYKDSKTYLDKFSKKYVNVTIKNDSINEEFNGIVVNFVETDEKEYDACYVIFDSKLKYFRYINPNVKDVKIRLLTDSEMETDEIKEFIEYVNSNKEKINDKLEDDLTAMRVEPIFY